MPTANSPPAVAFDVHTLWALHERELGRWLASRCASRAEAEDLLQDVWVKCLRQGDAVARLAQPRAWLFEVTRNTWLDHLRRAHPTLPLSEEENNVCAPQPDAEPLDGLAQACLPRVLQELDAQDREAIELCDLNQMSQADYAQRKGISLSAAKSRVQRARARMREHMVAACQVSLDATGRVDDFVPRVPKN